MAEIIKDITANWNWEGDEFALQGFNIAVSEESENPKTKTVASTFADSPKTTSGDYDYAYNFSVESSTDGGTTWDLCTNKSQIPNITTADSLMIRETLNTPNSGITSTLSELKAYIYTDEDNEWKMYTINPDGQCYVNAEPVTGSLNSIIDIDEDKISFKKNNMFDELLINDGPVDEATIQNWYEMDKPFVDLYPKTNTNTPTNVVLTEV
jgi:hypothetical protein